MKWWLLWESEHSLRDFCPSSESPMACDLQGHEPPAPPGVRCGGAGGGLRDLESLTIGMQGGVGAKEV